MFGFALDVVGSAALRCSTPFPMAPPFAYIPVLLRLHESKCRR
jgi:hypothetical protein